MIQLKNIGKSYEKSQVLWDFSYEFKEHGMYVLFGDSGCGKTTLLNIMAGMISIEEGEICAQIQGGKYLTQYQMNDAEYQEQIGYITQDTFFVDYLTMWENMKLCTDDSEKIRQICTRFGIQELLKKYPGQLSGGERQRVALVQAVLREKKILLLDEPTAALDKENKEKVFKMLWELKREKLIVCACHDKDIVPYTDEMILFENVNGKKEEKEKEGKAAFTQEVRIKEKKKKQKTEMKNGSKNQKLFRAICRQYRKTGWMEYTIMLIVFMVTILTLAYCYDFEGKLAASLKEKYHQNGVIVGIPVALHSQEFMEQLEEKYEVVESVFRYYENAPLIPPDTESTVDPNDFDSIGVLPFSKEAFPYSDHIRYGSYFTEENQVILGWETAKELSSEPQNLIHTTYHTKLYDKEYELEIIGIFAPVDEPMDKYMKTIDEPLEDDYGVFTNGKFTKKYAFDDVTGETENTGGKVKYAFYFADSKKLGDFEKEFAGNQNDKDKVSTEKIRYFAEYTTGTASYSDYLYPAAYTIILMSVFLYYTLKKIQLVYGQKELCVYQYYGYSYRKIKWCQIGYYLLELSALYMTAFVLSAGVSGVVNHLNETKKFTEFLLFKMDYQRVGILYGILAVFSVVASWSIFVGLKAKGWYRLLMERRDLL